MSKQNLQPYKGARDFYPEDKAFQKWMFAVWRRVAEGFGYEEYDAPILEPTDLYRMKGSDEIVNEQTYTFEDRGGRSVTIRTEMTPSVSRMVAARQQELAYPVRWYSIPNLWRYERTQRGRLREFWQLNVDIFGVDSIWAEYEVLQVTDGIFQEVGAKRSSYEIKLNSRKLVNTALQQCGLNESECTDAIRLIDRMKKMSAKDFAEKLDNITGSTEQSMRIIDFMKAKKIDDLESSLQNLASTKQLSKLLSLCRESGIKNISFAPDLMRGFDYYTDIVFEVFDTDPENNRSLFGGGRYDGLVGMFGGEPVPTVGFGMGDVTFQNFLESHKLLPKIPSMVEVRMLVMSDELIESAEKLAGEMREENVNVAIDFSGKKLDKQFKSADKAGVRYVIIIGQNELDNGQFTLKDMKTSKEEKHSIARIISIIKDSRT